MTGKTETTAARRGRRPAVGIDEQIADAERKLLELKERKRSEEKANAEKNRKAISELIKGERLDTVDVEEWKRRIPKIKALFGLAEASGSEKPAGGKSVSDSPRQEEAVA